MSEPPTPPPPGPKPEDLDHEARLEAVLESVSDGFYALDRDYRFVVFNRAAEEYFGLSRDLVIGRLIWDLFPYGRGATFEKACRAAMEDRAATTFETSSRQRPERIVEVRVLPMRDGGIAVSLNDITDRRRAEDALRAELARSEEILESIYDAFYAVDAEWRFTYVNRMAEVWWGRRREDLLGKVSWQEFPQVFGSASSKAHLTAARERRVVRLEAVSPIIDRWIDISIFPSAAGGLSVYFRDITERKQAEQRQRLLVNELNHRVKNSLATVQSIAARSLRGKDVPAEARERFMARLMALARANDILVAENWRGASLHAVAVQVASPHAGVGESERFHIEGPEVQLSPQAATAMALALHELATNAAKYGALATPEGRVELAWSIEEEEAGRRRLHMIWRETGGPAVAPPRHSGFGTRLIERGLKSGLKAEVRLDHPTSGLVCTITAPLGEAVSARAPPARAR